MLFFLFFFLISYSFSVLWFGHLAWCWSNFLSFQYWAMESFSSLVCIEAFLG